MSAMCVIRFVPVLALMYMHTIICMIYIFQYSLVVLSLIVAQIIAVVLWILMNAEVSNFKCPIPFTYKWRHVLEEKNMKAIDPLWICA